ncbi:MAG: histone deacetylase, partial [Gemmatimonadota bacterium]
LRAAVASAQAGGKLVTMDPVREPDTIVSGATWAASAGSAGAAIEACRGVVEGRFRNAFAACRPPGHHATANRAMGFCFFNSVAVAARWLQDAGHAERILIVDWDVHHGNGTQDIFYSDPSVFVLNLHQVPHYPGTGGAEERGEGAGEGSTLNIPLEAGTPREEFLTRFRAALDSVLGVFDPDFILVSCGFDVLAGDPLGGQRLDVEDMHTMTAQILARAEAQCSGRLVLLLEGGYDAVRTGAGAVMVLRALAGLGPEES